MLDPTNVEEKNVYEKEGGPGFIILDDDSQITFKAATPSNNNNNNNLSILNPLHWKKIITKKLEKSHIIITTIYTIIAAFSAYFSIYGISSSLFAATFDNVKVFGGLDLKVAFSISQMIGYAISKVAGAILIPTIKRHQRWPLLVLLAVLAEIPLLFFAIFPPEGQVIMVLLSGIPLAWLWGIMVMYLEGRTTSEFLLMGLYLSVMVASGAAKSSAAAVLKSGISEAWMPCICGAVSAVIFIFFVSLLDAIPDPSSDDKKVRSERRTMTQAEARRYLVRWAPGLVIVTLTYSLLTAYRNFRDYFAPELWRDLEGEDFDPSRFTQSELPVGICTAVAYSLLYWIKDNKKAFYAILGVMFAGGFMILIATISQTSGAIDPLSWMIMVGVGLYMAYIPPGAMLYDRFNGATGNPYTSVFMIYLSDVCGYSVTLTVLFYRNFGKANLRYVDFFHSLSYISAIACMVGMVIAGIYFIITMRNISPVIDNNGMPVPVDEETGLPMTEISLDDEIDNNNNSNNSNNETDGDSNNNNEKNEKSGKKKNKNRKKKEESASLVSMPASP